MRNRSPSRVQSRLRRRTVALAYGGSLAVACVLAINAAQAQSFTWGGAGSTTATTDYNLGTNWSTPPAGAPPVVAGQSALFDATGATSVVVTAGPVVPDSWTFSATSQSYAISGAAVNFSLAGPGGGIVNNANSGQSISIANDVGESVAGVQVQQLGNSTLILSGTNAYTGGTIISGFGTVQVTNNSSVGSGTVTLEDGQFQAGAAGLTFNSSFRINQTLAGSAIDANGFVLAISGNITDGIGGAGKLTVVDSAGGGAVILTGANTYTGGTTICSCAALELGTLASSGSIIGPVTNEGVFNIVNANTAGITSINNDGSFGPATTTFFNDTSASSIAITNRFGGQTDFGVASGTDTATAGNAVIVNRTGGVTVFNAMTTAGNATITNRFIGATFFFDLSTAGNATITNRFGGQTVFGTAFGTDAPSAGNAIIVNRFGGNTEFDAFATAGNATITNRFGGSTDFFDFSTAGDATIITRPGGATFFHDNTTGGNAQFITDGSGFVDFSGSLGTNGDGRITAGSIAGSGFYFIGAGNTLVAGSNNLSTEVSGVIADFNPCGCGPAGPGALEKVGAGTLILSGANTYTGGTTISSGMLQLGNGGATGSIIGNVLDNGIFAIDRSDAFTFGAVISGSGAFQQIGTGTTTLTAANTYSGPTTVTGGTLAIAASGSITSNVTNNATFNNAGTVTGSLTNNGTTTNTGTISGGLTNNALVNANGGAINGAIANNAGALFNVAGTVTSNSTFTNAAGGTLAVGTTGTYTLQGLLTNSGVVTVAGGGQLIATIGGITNNAGGTITVAIGGTVKDDLNNAGAVTNNGAYTANVATNTGTITNNSVWTGNVASNIGTINNNLTWTGTVSNGGTFTNNAGATVSGLLTNTAGVTTNNGTLGGGAIISGGALIGTGSVTNLTVGNGGILLPGNGTPGSSMTVTGNLAFQSGALYLVQLNGTTSSFVSVAGTAALAGTVGASFVAGSSVMKQYTILTAAGGASGVFDGVGVAGLPASLVATLSYDPTHAFLNFALDFNVTPGLNANQRNVGNALANFFNANGGIPTVFAALAPAGLTQASGELATGTQQATFDAMNLFLGLLTDPFVAGRGNGLFGGTGATPFAEEGDSASAYAANKPHAARDAFAKFSTKAVPARNDLLDPRWSVWGAGYGGSSTADGNAAIGSNSATARAFGFAAGADYLLSPATLMGFALAGGGTNFSVNGSGFGRSDLFQAGAFARHTAGAAYLSGALAYGWQDVTTDRTVAIAGIDRLHAQFNANAFSGRAEAGYRFVTPWMGITPYAAGQFTLYSLPAYAEQALAGAGTFALNYAAKDVTASRTELGLRTDRSFAMQNGILTLRGRAAWAHDFNTDRNISAVFQTLPGAAFLVNGAARARDAALTTASAELKWLNGFSLAATFEGEFSDVTRSYAGKGIARYSW